MSIDNTITSTIRIDIGFIFHETYDQFVQVINICEFKKTFKTLVSRFKKWYKVIVTLDFHFAMRCETQTVKKNVQKHECGSIL